MVIKNGAIQQITYNFLFDFECKYMPIPRLRQTAHTNRVACPLSGPTGSSYLRPTHF